MTPPSTDLVTLERFIKACGLRRTELEQVRCRDIGEDDQGHIQIHVAASAECPERDVPVFDSFSEAVIEALLGHALTMECAIPTLQAAQQRRSPDDLLFPLGIPKDLDVERLRYQYAWFLYVGTIEALTVISYPSTFQEVAQQVKRAMGCKRLNPHLQRWIAREKRQFVRDAKDAGILPAKQG